MGETYYIDTSVWRDYYENRVAGAKPLGEFAFQFFRYCKQNKCIILFSDLVIHELGTAYNNNEIKEMMRIVSDYGLLKKVQEPSKEQYQEARLLGKNFNVPFGDALNAVLARDNDAVLIYRDSHFHELQRIVTIRYTEEVT